jgi:DNA modification methylase
MQGRGHLIRGDARRIPLGDRSVHMAATSPPYYGLRDYGLKPSRWPAMSYRPMVGLPAVEVPALECCLGLEPTPEAFVGHLVLVFREVYRVLRDDGTLWLNLGDSYGSGSRKKRVPDRELAARAMASRPQGFGKQLMGMPWRVAFALQADGWVLRSAPPWLKPSPMPESSGAESRPGTGHESIFLLAKRPDYFYDRFAVLMPCSESTRRDRRVGTVRVFDGERAEGYGVNATQNRRYARNAIGSSGGRNRRTNDWAYESLDDLIGHHRAYLAHLEKVRSKGGLLVDESGDPAAFLVASEGSSEAHFATFPRKLVRPMILAGTSEKGCCPGCGAPWRRVVRKDRKPTRPGKDSKIRMPRGWAGNGVPHKASEWNRSKEEVGNRDPMRHVTEVETVGWGPSCGCPEQPPVPCLVLDPFNGSGKTGEQALLLGRSYVGMDLSWEYLSTIAVDRLERGLRPHKPRARPVADPEGQNSLFDMEGV